jgi:hypothetical protein
MSVARALRPLKVVAMNVAIFAALCVVLEGSVSVFLILRDVAVLAWVAEPYSEYDAGLGWIARKNVRLPDIFGKGVGVQTNGQRFRAASEIAPDVAPGRIRVICSGDSFTFGDGVDNRDTWCEQLSARDRRIEPVNLGQGGYGVDQAYLRFLRDTRGLGHQAHLFAFINDDFRRMQSATFLGFGKPVLVLEKGVPVAANVPVPRLATSHPWVIAIPRAIADTRLAQLVGRVQTKYGSPKRSQAECDAETQEVVRAVFADLKRVNGTRSSRLFLVHLPTMGELGGENAWSRFVARVASEQQIPLIDVVGAFRSRMDARDLFLQEGSAGGHFNAAGHAVAAEVVAARLTEDLR